MTADSLLRVAHLSKTFDGGTKVLDDVSLEVRAGEVVAVVGHNGSGKSTLVKILAGFHQADPGGTVGVGQPSPGEASGEDTGERLHFVHQDLGLIMSQSTTENLALGRQCSGLQHVAPLRMRAEDRRAQDVVGRFGGSRDVRAPLTKLLPAERTIVAIARSLDGWDRPDNVLVLDEPTATLHRDEATLLLGAIRRVAEQGGAVLFISHRLEEVVTLADRVVVLRNGRVVHEADRMGFDHDDLVRMIVGTTIEEADRSGQHGRDVGTPVLVGRGVAGPGVRHLDLTVGRGEIVGVAGLSGSGRDTIGSMLAGALPRTAGTVTAGTSPLPSGDVAASIASGVAFVPADRRQHGAIMDMSARENLTLPRLRNLRRRFGRLDVRAERNEARTWSANVGLRPEEPERRLNQFSGGNQQKVVLAKWLRIRPSILIMDEPTQGVDVGAKETIYDLLRAAADEGMGLLLCSSDEKELAALCHRVIVLNDGLQVSELTGDGITTDTLVAQVIGKSTGTPAPRVRVES